MRPLRNLKVGRSTRGVKEKGEVGRSIRQEEEVEEERNTRHAEEKADLGKSTRGKEEDSRLYGFIFNQAKLASSRKEEEQEEKAREEERSIREAEQKKKKADDEKRSRESRKAAQKAEEESIRLTFSRKRAEHEEKAKKERRAREAEEKAKKERRAREAEEKADEEKRRREAEEKAEEERSTREGEEKRAWFLTRPVRYGKAKKAIRIESPERQSQERQLWNRIDSPQQRAQERQIWNRIDSPQKRAQERRIWPQIDDLAARRSTRGATHTGEFPRNPIRSKTMQQSIGGSVLAAPPPQQQQQQQLAATSQLKLCELRELRPSVNSNVHTKFIILEKGQASRMTGEGGPLVSVALVADSTAAVHLQLWGAECDSFQPSDIVRLTNGLFSYQKNNMVLRAGKKGQLEKIGQFTMTFVENPNMSRVQWVADPSNSKLLLPNFSSPQGHGMLVNNFRG